MLQEIVEKLKNLIYSRAGIFQDPYAVEEAKQELYEYMDNSIKKLENPTLNASLWIPDSIDKLEALREFRDLSIIRMNPRTVLAQSLVTPGASDPASYLLYWDSILQYKYPFTGEAK